MSRMVLWTALSDAADAAKDASADYRRTPTCRRRNAMVSAFHAYADALYPVVGQAVAFAYESTLRDPNGIWVFYCDTHVPGPTGLSLGESLSPWHSPQVWQSGSALA